MSPRNLVELISEVRPRSALFTTYTLSLSFIESALLPTLRQAGCKEVAILVDADELEGSLVETQAHGAGRRYRLAAVQAPGKGVFHPKLAYLACKDQDILTVGSGNLTTPGQHRQLECLDAVSSLDYPDVFADLADFASRLAHMIPSASQQAVTLLKLLEKRARTASATPSRLTPEQQAAVRLVHTLQSPASSQIAEFWRQQGVPANTLVALAPFHAPDGGPVQRLGNALAVRKIQVGLDPVTLIAPLRQPGRPAIEAAHKFSFVVPRSADSQRHLHAKVFEVQAKGVALVVTGSVNATEQSLESTKNIEVSLARVLPNSPFKWEDCVPQDFVPNKYEPAAGDENRAYMDAVLNQEGIVQGSVWSPRALPVSALATVEQFPEQPPCPDVPVQLTPQGRFSFRLPPGVDLSGSVQLTLQGPGLTARCWLSVEDELSATDHQRREKQAVRRILRGEFKNDDLLELLQIFVRAATPLAQRPAATPRAERKDEELAGGDEPFSFAGWAGSAAQPRQGAAGLAEGHHDALRAFVHWLNSKKQAPAKDPGPHANANTQHAEEAPHLHIDLPQDDNAGQNLSDQMLAECLRNVLEKIPALLRDHPAIAEGPVLAMVAGSHAFNLSLESPWNDERAYQRLRHWLEIYSEFEYPHDGRSDLSKFALGAACLIVVMAKERGLAAPYPALKDLLLRFDSGLRNTAPAQKDIEEVLQKDVFLNVSAPMKAAAVLALMELWQAKSLDERIEELVEHALQPEYKASDEDEATFPGGVQAIRAIQRTNPNRRYHGLLQTERELNSRGCPHCYQAFTENVLGKLRANHIIVCPNTSCRKAIFHFADEQTARRVRERLKNA